MSYSILFKMLTKTIGTDNLVLETVSGEKTPSIAGITSGDTIIYRLESSLGTEEGQGTYLYGTGTHSLIRKQGERLSLDGRPVAVYFLEEDLPKTLFEIKDSSNNILVYAEDPTGNIRLVDNAKYFDDIRVPTTSLAKGGVNDPQLELFKRNLAGTSQGVYIYYYSPSVIEELFFAAQFPHSWDGTAIYPHIHWTPKVNADGSPAAQKVVWGLEYSWANYGESFSVTETIYGSDHSPSEELVAGKHYITRLGTPNYFITPSSIQNGLSSMLIGRVFRFATDSGDTYESDAGLLEIDFHISMDSLGSDEEYLK